MVKVKVHRLGRWFTILYREISDELSQWARKHDLDPGVIDFNIDSYLNMGWALKKPPGSNRVLDLSWWLFGSILDVQIQVYGDEWVDSAIEFAHTLELRIPPMLPKGFKMREIEVEVKPPQPKPLTRHPMLGLSIAVPAPNYKSLQQVFAPTLKYPGSPGYFDTIGSSFAVKDIIVGDREVKFFFRFINSKPSLSSLRRMSFRGCHAGIFLYELTNKTSFLQALKLIDEFDRVTGKNRYRVLLGFVPDSESQWDVSREMLDFLLIRGQLSHFELDLSMEEKQHEQVLNEIYRVIAEEIMKQSLK